MSKTNYLQAVISDLQRTAGPYRCAKKRHNRLAGTPAGAATFAASRCNGRDQRTRMLPINIPRPTGPIPTVKR